MDRCTFEHYANPMSEMLLPRYLPRYSTHRAVWDAIHAAVWYTDPRPENAWGAPRSQVGTLQRILGGHGTAKGVLEDCTP